MKVFKCDRCGAELEDCGFGISSYPRAKSEQLLARVIDLCDPCYEQFLKFLNAGRRDDK